MPVPGALYQECESCGDVTLHEVVHGKISRGHLELTVRCGECGTTSHQAREESKPLRLRTIYSEGRGSRRTHVEVEADEVLAVGDELLVDGVPAQVRGIEVGQDRRVEAAPVKDIMTLWTVRFDEVRIKYSINMGHRTKAVEQVATPDEEFTVGEMVRVGGVDAVIHRIKTWDRVLRKGSAEARDIVRIYGKAIRGSR